jgi:hypothetical protein
MFSTTRANLGDLTTRKTAQPAQKRISVILVESPGFGTLHLAVNTHRVTLKVSANIDLTLKHVAKTSM